MPIEQLILLAIIQGLTEFLPISSSAHLILPAQLGLFAEDQGPLIDVAVHVGSLFAVVAYFRKDVAALFRGVPDILARRWTWPARLLTFLVLATIPTILVGGLLVAFDLVDSLRSAEVIAWATIFFAGVIWYADAKGARTRRTEEMTLRGAMWIGAAQVLALIPGTSRSGITMAAGRFLGYERADAARFSMLLSLPTIAAFGLLAAIDLATGEEAVVMAGDAAVAAVLSFLSAYAAIWFFMAWIDRIGFAPFAIYRLVLGLGLLAYLYL